MLPGVERTIAYESRSDHQVLQNPSSDDLYLVQVELQSCSRSIRVSVVKGFILRGVMYAASIYAVSPDANHNDCEHVPTL